MSRINTNVQSLVAQNALRKNNAALSTSLERLSTGLKINSGADDPAGLIASENLKSEETGITSAIDNANRATNIIGTAEGGLSEVSDLLTQLQGLITSTANDGGLSDEQKAANQQQVDSILGTINRISQTTTFQGKQLLNGNYGYTTSGVASTAITDLQVNAASVPENGATVVNVHVVASATYAAVNYTGGTVGTGGASIQIGGSVGTQTLTFASGTTVSSIAASINAISSQTGVSATVNGSNVAIDSTELGSSQFVSIKAVTGTFTSDISSSGISKGKDAVVSINGTTAEATGTSISYRSGGLDLQFDLKNTFNKPGDTTFDVTGGGATFQLSSKVTGTGQESIGIGSVSTSDLGDASTGYLSSLASGGTNSLTSGNLTQSQKIVDEAVNQVSELRGRLGAFETYTLGSTINSLSVAYENASSAESDITDTDFAAETANLTREQVLVSSATTVLSHANSTPQNALQLLQNS